MISMVSSSWLFYRSFVSPPYRYVPFYSSWLQLLDKLLDSLRALSVFISLLPILGIQSYKEIALHTSGQIFPLINSNEINSFRNYVKTSLRPSVTVAMGHFKATFGRKRQFPTNSHDIQVESGIEILQVTIDVLAKNSAR